RIRSKWTNRWPASIDLDTGIRRCPTTDRHHPARIVARVLQNERDLCSPAPPTRGVLAEVGLELGQVGNSDHLIRLPFCAKGHRVVASCIIEIDAAIVRPVEQHSLI